MNTEFLATLLVRASQVLDSALVAPAVVIPLAAATKVLVGVASGQKFNVAPLVRETRETVDVEFVDGQVRLEVVEEFARFTRGGSTVAAPARDLIASVDDSHFTGENDLARCACDESPAARALYSHREGYRELADWPTTAAGLREYNAMPRWSRKAWLERGGAEAEAVARYFALVRHVESVEETCPAAQHYRTTQLDLDVGYTRGAEVPQSASVGYENPAGSVARGTFRHWYRGHFGPAKVVGVESKWGTSFVHGRSQHPANEKALYERARWDDAEWRRLAWPVVSFQHHYVEGNYRISGDGDRGFRADPTWIASEQTLEREYHLPRTVRWTDFKRKGGYIVLDDAGRRIAQSGTALRSGEVHREYRRRDWCEANGRLYLPFLPPHLFKHASRFLHRQETRRLHAKRQRAAIARLVVALGGDLHDPKVASWVAEVGYQAALDALRARARREGVQAYC